MGWRRKLRVGISAGAVLLFGAALIAAPEFKKSRIKIGKHVIAVELADDENKRAYGLMNRQQMAGGTGMLFVFEYQRPLSFWMKDTLIPLSIGFFDENKVLVDIQDMEVVPSGRPEDLRTYQSLKPAIYALEVPKGWFRQQKIKVGAQFEFMNAKK